MRFLLEAGYSGWSMSNNAVAAYQDGEKPLTKWSKSDIISQLRTSDKWNPKIEKLSLKDLRDNFLYQSSWHHTSSYYNKTDFYSIDFDALEDITDEELDELINKPKSPKIKKEPEKEFRKIHYLTWEGTRNHPKAVDHEGTYEIVGNWAITPDGKKSIFANGFRFLD